MQGQGTAVTIGAFMDRVACQGVLFTQGRLLPSVKVRPCLQVTCC